TGAHDVQNACGPRRCRGLSFCTVPVTGGAGGGGDPSGLDLRAVCPAGSGPVAGQGTPVSFWPAEGNSNLDGTLGPGVLPRKEEAPTTSRSSGWGCHEAGLCLEGAWGPSWAWGRKPAVPPLGIHRGGRCPKPLNPKASGVSGKIGWGARI